jgi:ASCH domain
MKALSIQQPWGHLIASGQKDIENRDWPTRFRGRFLIHVGKRIDIDFDARDFPGMALQMPPVLDAGGIIGEAEIVDCVTKSTSPWFFGKFGFVIRNAKLLPFRPYRGALRFFDVA